MHLVNGPGGKRYLPFYSANMPFCNYFPDWIWLKGKSSFLDLLNGFITGAYYLYAQQFFYAEKARFHGLHVEAMTIQDTQCPATVHTYGSRLPDTNAWKDVEYGVFCDHRLGHTLFEFLGHVRSLLCKILAK